MRRFAMGRRHGKGGEVWQIIYIDLMTNVMIFFVILWAINQRQSNAVSAGIGDETVKMVDLPGDVLFPAGQAELSAEGRSVFSRLFSEDTATVLNFDTGGLVKRLLVVHGHTDSDGLKDENFGLGYQRAIAAYHEIARYSEDVPDHVVICTHADNTPVQQVPELGELSSPSDVALVREAKSKNRRIAIEDKLLSQKPEEAP